MTALADLDLPEFDPTDPSLSGERWHAAMAPLREQMDHNIINVNGEDHGRLRKLVNPALTPRAVNRYRPAMREILTELWEPVGAGEGRVDLVAALTKPYP